MHSISSVSKGGLFNPDRILSVEFSADGQPVRKVVSRSNARVTGKYPSLKMGDTVQYDGVNEGNACKLLDAWPAVRSYAPQPCVVRYFMDGVERRHIPDFLVGFGESRELWEVKTEDDASNPEVMRRTALMTAGLPAFGYTYRLVLAEDLARQPRLGNIEFLLQWGRNPVPLVEREKLRHLFALSCSLPLGFFQPGGPGAHHRRHVCRLVLEGVLSIDVNKPRNTSTAVIWNQQEDKSWQ